MPEPKKDRKFSFLSEDELMKMKAEEAVRIASLTKGRRQFRTMSWGWFSVKLIEFTLIEAALNFFNLWGRKSYHFL